MTINLGEKLREAFGRCGAQDFAGAERLCGEILRAAPGNPDALHLLGLVRLAGGNAREAASLIGRALEGNPGSALMAENFGVAHLVLRDYRRAEDAFRQALKLGAAHGLLYMRLGIALGAQRQVPEALAAMRTAAERAPADPDVHLNLGNLLAEQGQAEEAQACFRKVLALQPGHAVAHFNLGTLYQRMGQLGEAGAAFKRALAIAPDTADAHHNLGMVYAQQGRLDEAIERYRKVLALDPQHVQAHNNLGNVLRARGQRKEAAELFERAQAARPEHPDAYINLGNLRAEQGLYVEAEALYEAALQRDPGSFEAHYNLGRILRQQGELGAAIDHYRRALALGARPGDACNELGGAYREAGSLDEAIASYRQAIAGDAGHVHARYNLGETLKIVGRLDEAAALDEQALALKPDYLPALDALTHLRQHMCAWDGIEELWERLRREAVGRPEAGVTPFSSLSWPTTAAEQLACAKAWSEQALAAATASRARLGFDFATRRRQGKLRIGYLSAGFRRHALSHLCAELFELHDRARFEVVAYSSGYDDGSAIRERIKRACDRFVDVAGESFVATAQRIYRDEIDILVDLDGWTFGARTATLALRPAPVQVNWLGYPGTMGAECIDYIVADPFVIPAGMEQYYAERVVRLPDCYQINDRQREVSAEALTRAACGLPERGFVFCCFNQAYKITPAVFGVWMRVLQAVPGSVLWLAEANRWMAGNLRRAAAPAGIAAERLIFAARKQLPEYLVQYRLADLAIDTFPYTSHTTASDALWMGCPLATCAGETFASRVAGSILSAAGIRELVTESLETYERLVIELAASPEKLEAMRHRVEAARASSPLFDTPRFVRNLEAAYEEMFTAQEFVGLWDDKLLRQNRLGEGGG